MKPTNSRATIALRRAPSFRRSDALSLLFERHDFFAAIDALELIAGQVERIESTLSQSYFRADPPRGWATHAERASSRLLARSRRRGVPDAMRDLPLRKMPEEVILASQRRGIR
jgi:hypothetical protein